VRLPYLALARDRRGSLSLRQTIQLLQPGLLAPHSSRYECGEAKNQPAPKTRFGHWLNPDVIDDHPRLVVSAKDADLPKVE
jgi:hypothetical protein